LNDCELVCRRIVRLPTRLLVWQLKVTPIGIYSTHHWQISEEWEWLQMLERQSMVKTATSQNSDR